QKYAKIKKKVIRANEAGGSRSQECILFLVEGDSAKAFAEKLIDLIPDGHDLIGVFPMRGKPLNVMAAPPWQVIMNQEFKDLKTMLGLRENVNYNLEENVKTLNYGKIHILADADTDGTHIKSLILNFFYYRFLT